MKRFLLLLPFLAACSNGPVTTSLTPVITSIIQPYRIDVRQGNFVTQDMVAQLKPGLSRDQVRFILGSPLVTDMFHADRWDYIYRQTPGKGRERKSHFTLYFRDEILVKIDGENYKEY